MNLFRYAEANPLRFSDPLGLDTTGCDLPPWLKVGIESECVLECCAEHDRCYDEYNCTSKSWTGGGAGCGDPTSCPRCNLGVSGCLARCSSFLGLLGFYDSPNRPDFYCAAQHRFVSSRDDAACDYDHGRDGCCGVPGRPLKRVPGAKRWYY